MSTSPGLPAPAGPDTTIWIDDLGKPRPVIGLGYEELTEAWRLLQGFEQPNAQPPFSRQKLEIHGRLVGDRVQLVARYEIRLTTNQPTSAPLGMGGAILIGRPSIDGGDASRQFVDYDEQRGGYVAWLRGEAGDQRSIELPLLAPTSREGVQTLLKLNVPRSGQSTLTLDMPNEFTDPFVSPGAVLEAEQPAAGGGRLRVQGLVGDFQLGWRSVAETPATQRRSVVSVEGLILHDIDRQSIRTEAELLVRSFGGELDRFRVRLPEGAELAPTTADEDGADRAQVTLLPEEGESGDSDAARRPLCLVTLPERATGPVRVRIVTERPLQLGESDEIDLSGFEVIGADRQVGYAAIRVIDDRLLEFASLSGARRVEVSALPAELRRPSVTSGARYFGQPWRLGVRLSPLPQQIEATPKYRLVIRPTEALLTTTITFRAPGARVSSFTVDLHDWDETPDRIEPVGVVDDDRVRRSRTRELYIPLKRPASRWEEIRFSARRPLRDGDETLRLNLPTAKADTHGESELLVVVDPAVQLTPLPQRSQRLRAAALLPENRDPADPSGTRSFLFRGFLPGQVLVAEKRNRPVEVDVEVASSILVGPEESAVEQTFEYAVRYGPISTLRFAALEDAVDEPDLGFQLVSTNGSDEPIGPGREPPPTGTPLQHRVEIVDGKRELVVGLPRPWIGPATIRATFKTPLKLRDVTPATPTRIPLLSPLGVDRVSHTASVRSANRQPLALPAEAEGWRSANRQAADVDSGTLTVSREGAVSAIPIGRRIERELLSSNATLRRAWFQTWVGAAKTQQRAALRFDTAADNAVVILPESLAQVDVEVYLDGRLCTDFQKRGRRIRAPLPAASLKPGSARRHTLEVRYFETGTEASAARFPAVRLDADCGLADTYWEVVLPAEREEIAPPGGFGRAARSSALLGLTGDRPLLDSAELESWAGAASRPTPPPAAQRRLYFAFGLPDGDAAVVLRTADRRALIVACSAVILAIGLALIYTPWLRSPAALFSLAAVGAAIGLAYPVHFLMIARAGMLGAFLAGVSMVIAFLLHRPAPPAAETPSSTIVPGQAPPGTDTFITLKLGSSTSAPTVSLPPDNAGA